MLKALSLSLFLHVWVWEREEERERECVVCIFFPLAAAASTSCLSTLTTTKLIALTRSRTHTHVCSTETAKPMCVCVFVLSFYPTRAERFWEEEERERERENEKGGGESGENERDRGIFVCRWNTPIWNRWEGFCCKPLKRSKIIPKSAFIWERRKRKKSTEKRSLSILKKKTFFNSEKLKKNFDIFVTHFVWIIFVTFHHISSHTVTRRGQKFDWS